MIPPIYNEDWPEDVMALYEHDMQEMWDNSLMRHIWNMYHGELDRYFNKVAEFGAGPMRILDVGCAQGTLALLLAEKGHSVVALDMRQQFLDYARARHESGEIEFVCANALEVELDGQFDIIFANQIIEHLVYPVEFFTGLMRHLCPGGLMISTTPNHAYLKHNFPSFRELGDVTKYKDRQFSSDGDGHFFFYTQTELQDILQSVGLQQVEVSGYCTPWISGHMKLRYFHRLLHYRLLVLLDRLAINLGPKYCFQLMACGRKDAE